MTNPPLWVQYSRLALPAGELIMPGISAGIKTQADVNSQPRQPTKLSRNLQNPATWTYIWVGGAFAYLLVTYFGILRIGRLAS